MGRNNKVAVHCNVLLVRLLFTTLLLNLIQQRELIKDSNLSDCFKRSFAEHGMNVFKYLDQLHSIILPFDSELGSLDLKEGTLKPEYNGKEKPGKSL